MSDRESDIPKPFQDFLDESGLLNTPEANVPWSQQLRLAVEERGYKIIAWKEVGEGAVAGVIANKKVIDPVAYVINDPTDLTSRERMDFWDVLPPHCDILPETVAYNQWGTNLDNEDTEKPDVFAEWITNAEEFIHDLRKVRRQEQQNIDDLW